MENKSMALRPYLEKIEKTCSELKKDELVRLVVRIAEDCSPGMRQDFLDKLQLYLSRDKQEAKKSNDSQDEELLYEDLEGLKQSILERIDSIEDGTYWDDPDDDHWEGGYYDDDPDILSDLHKGELAAFFDLAGEYFLQNKLPEARKLYKSLFELISEIDRGYLMPDLRIDIREAHARYCRTVYELSCKEERVEAMLEAMAVTEPSHDFENIQGRDMALLQDVIDAQVGTLPDFQGFMIQWEEALAQNGHEQERLARLRLETANMLRSYEGLAGLARSWKNEQPLGYFVWLQHLVKAQQWSDVGEAAKDALDDLEMGSESRIAAVSLVQAGQHLGNDDFIHQGRREAFRSSLSENDLLLLLDQANRLGIREKEIAWAIEVVRKSKKEIYGADRLLAMLFLMTGDLEEAAGLSKKEEVYGWSGGGPEPLFFCAVLYCMAGKRAQDCTLLNSMLDEYTVGSIYFDSYQQDYEEPKTTFAGEIKKGLAKVDITQEKFAKHIPSTLEKGKKRVEYIVSNKYRNAYGRAAYVLGAMAEIDVAQGNDQKAKELVHSFYFEKFNRFIAFRREVQDAFAESLMLEKVRGMLSK